MMIPKSLLIGPSVLGVVIALLLWWFGVIAWWAIPLVAVFAPVGLIVAILITFYVLWVASGSH
jgi:hypothetical protein